MIDPKNWKPIGIDSLEPNAFKSVVSLQNLAIVAGPGAGKTELLAQKALYLFQANICPAPQRVLAISFKKDSAKNLKDRIVKRAPEFQYRFDSFTFDGFAKSLFDRFFLGLSDWYKIDPNYHIENINVKEFLEFCRTVYVPKEINEYQIRNFNGRQLGWFKREYFYKNSIKPDFPFEFDTFSWLANEYWKYKLSLAKGHKFEFPMISRFTELLLSRNPLLIKSIRMTYSDVFLDEFQDTTNIQFDLLKKIFLNSSVRLTAVGDNKQKIMGWAMALDDAFVDFYNVFGAQRLDLFHNYRSAKNLVNIQHFFAKAIDPNTILQKAYSDDDSGICKLVLFSDENQEALEVSKAIKRYVNDEKILPAQIAILSKIKPGNYTEEIIKAIKRTGIKARVEDLYQDLLKEDVIIFIINTLSVVFEVPNPEAYSNCLDFLIEFMAAYEEEEIYASEKMLNNILKTLRGYKNSSYSNEILKEIVDYILEQLGPIEIKKFFPQFSQGRYYDDVLRSFLELFGQEIENSKKNFKEGILSFLGEDSVKIMSIHKSKGLEFHTVMFIGLEDSAFWNFTAQKNEDISAFYVALSRARERMIFTFCEKRNTRGFLENQSTNKISELFSLLKAAGVPGVDLRNVSTK
tara:strand:+ start:135474 stop:137366 length:1893 start_codon:yes stop_codon:yes gene_type:complete